MESIINKLTEIESAASAIAEHAELQKSVLDKEYEEKRKQFDLDLEQETEAHLQKIREALEADSLRSAGRIKRQLCTCTQERIRKQAHTLCTGNFKTNHRGVTYGKLTRIQWDHHQAACHGSQTAHR